MEEHEGGCLCGQLRYRVRADGAQRVAYCHCKFCQRSTGGAYAIEPFFKAEEFEIIAGTASVYDHQSSGSGKMLHLTFCPKCGTKVSNKMDRYPDLIAVMAGTFDDPEWFEPAKVIRHVFTSFARKGTVIPPSINTYEAAALTIDGQPNAPVVYEDFHVVGR